MVCCAYCGLPATMTIVSNPDRVCLDHALEFWKGLLVYARNVSDSSADHDQLCTCRSCEKLSAPYPRAVAIATAGPAPRAELRFPIRLAS